ncbi:uncharacterized protein V3H82_019887 isoform 1-T1 [Fundulus diaphanus]
MSSDIYSKVHTSRKIRFTKQEPEDRTEWVEREVNIYESADDVAEDCMVSLPQEEDQQVHSPPAANKSPDRSVKLCKMVLWILMLAVIITLAIYLPLEIIKVKKSNSHLQAKLLANNSQLQAKSLDMAEKIGQLQATYLDMAANNTQLKAKLVDMAANNSQLQESYEILRKNHSQLTDEVNRLKDQVKGKWCPDGWARFGCSCYCKYKETKLWTESRKHCQDRGADLVIIDSPDEQDFVKKLNKNGESWIGLQSVWTVMTRTYEWRWVDGSAVTKTFWEARLTSDGNHATCCNDKGQWTRRYSSEYDLSYNYKPNGWICEK